MKPYLAVDSTVAFSIGPLRFIAWMGFLFSGLAFLGFIYTIVVILVADSSISGWIIVLLSILALSGLQLISLGIIGEYIGRIYNEAKRRPSYLIRERLGFAPGRDAE